MSPSGVESHRDLHERRSKQYGSEALTWWAVSGFGATIHSLRGRDFWRGSLLILTVLALKYDP